MFIIEPGREIAELHENLLFGFVVDRRLLDRCSDSRSEREWQC